MMLRRCTPGSRHAGLTAIYTTRKTGRRSGKRSGASRSRKQNTMDWVIPESSRRSGIRRVTLTAHVESMQLNLADLVAFRPHQVRAMQSAGYLEREATMSDMFKIPITQYWLYDCWIDADGNPC